MSHGVQNLRFTGDTLANIYLSKITNWNDPRIAKDNPGVSLPDKKIIVVHRSDSSGTSFIFTDYLSKVSKRLEERPRLWLLAKLAHRCRRQGQ